LVVVGAGFLLVSLVTVPIKTHSLVAFPRALVALPIEIRKERLFRKQQREFVERQEQIAKERGFSSVQELQSHLSAEEKLKREAKAREDEAHRKATARAQQELAIAKKEAEIKRRKRWLERRKSYFAVLQDLDDTVKELGNKVQLILNPQAGQTIGKVELIEAFQYAQSKVNAATEIEFHDRTYSWEQIARLAQLIRDEAGWDVPLTESAWERHQREEHERTRLRGKVIQNFDGGDGNPVCPTCGSQSIQRVGVTPMVRCNDCGKSFAHYLERS